MACVLGNKCAKNLCKRTVLGQRIIESLVTCFRDTIIEETNDFCCFRSVIEQWSLTVIKLLRSFGIMFAVFLPDDIYFLTQ